MINVMKKMKQLFIMLFVITVAFSINLPQGKSQVTISSGQTVTQNFDAIGTTATATLPTGWKVGKDSLNVRTVGPYSAAKSTTEKIAGNTMSQTAGNGIYNFGAGVPASATDRAIGFISSSTKTKSGNLYVMLQNNGTNNITSLTISYDVEKYRNGTNAAGFTVQLYYSADGTLWTKADSSNFATNFAGADTANNGFASAPGLILSVTAKSLNVNVAPGSNLYLAWNYSVTTGATTSNAKALGIDNVSIQAANVSFPDDATLSNIASSLGILSPVFSSTDTSYTVALPYGTTLTPTVTATPSNPSASVTVTPASDVTSATIANRTTTIHVVSQDLSTTKNYHVIFNVNATASNNDTLSALTCSATPLVPAFSGAILYYTVTLPYGSTITPTVNATAANPYATVTITPAVNVASTDSLVRTTYVKVKAENGVDSLIYKVQFNISTIAPIDVANIAALRAGLTDGTVYRLTEEAVLTFKQTYRNQKFVQDATAAILIDDLNIVITTTYNAGDGITNLMGTLTLYNQMLEFIPIINSGAPTSTGNVVTPQVKTVVQIAANDQAKLIKIMNANFLNATGNFAANQNYNLLDPTDTIVFRTGFTLADYIGTPVPTYTVNVTGLFIQHLTTKEISARYATDIEHSTSTNLFNFNDFTFEAYPNPSNGNINFSFNLDKSQTILFVVRDISGKEIYSFNNMLNAGAQIITWNGSENVENGVYFYSVTINNKVKNGKLIITK